MDAGETPSDLPPRLIEENMWRAIRHGLDGKLLDLERLADRASTRAAEALDRLAPGPARRLAPARSSTAPSASAA